ncbi:uncharacterized protein [Pempheris klunzingeri]|uniref:uncharacterized protein n=1 Tax=Pempheris klunzingeri TaxID=3127111 RepID=UPI00398047B2
MQRQGGAGLDTRLRAVTDAGGGRGGGAEADHRGRFEFCICSSAQLTRASSSLSQAVDMNLYRSFGSLMEAWVTEGGRCLDSELLGNNDEDSAPPSSDVGTNLRSESVDSGVETASCDASFAATSCSVSTGHAEMDTFTPEREASAPQSPLLSSPVPSSASSSSPCICTGRAHQVERTLQRTDSGRPQGRPEPLTVEEVLRRRPRASFLPKRPSSELTRGQRSLSCGLRRTADPSGSVRQASEMCRRPMSLSFDRRGSARTGSQEPGAWEGAGLGPGLTYLEQVCQMLEEVARQQMHGRAPQMEMDALQEHRDVESESAAAEDVSSPHEPQQRKHQPHTHFRQRSASDITSTALHLRRLNTDCRGQHLSTDDLLETADGKQESKQEETNTTDRSWRFKIGSLGREGQRTQPSEKSSARRRLSQLFRRRRTVPV